MNYPEYYKKAKEAYKKDGNATNDFSLSDANLVQFSKNHPHPHMSIDNVYFDHIDDIASVVDERMNNPKQYACYLPNINPKDDVIIRLDNPFDLPHLESVAEIICGNLERSFFNCYLHVDKVYVYRNIITNNKPRASWLWHYDNHPTEITKVMIYLTDVDSDSGPFEYLVDKHNAPIVISPSRTGESHWKPPKWHDSRIPEQVMINYLKNGAKQVKAVGEKSTTTIFDNNTIHRANIAKSGHRDVLVFQVKPHITKLTPRVNKAAWTGTFKHVDIYKNPNNLKQLLKNGIK